MPATEDQETNDIPPSAEVAYKHVTKNPYIPHKPTPKQKQFLMLPHKKVLFGGQAGGGKTAAQLFAALMFVNYSSYDAILFRRTYPQLAAAESLIEQSKKMLTSTDASWNQSKSIWTFPSGATVRFSHMKHPDNRFDHKSAAYHYIGFDEAGEFEPIQIRYLLSRLRKKTTDPVPLRFRLTTNPGGPGHDYIKSNYIESDDPDTVYLPSRLEDNPHIDTEEYEETLEELPPVERKRLREGDWDVQMTGELIEREWFEIVEQAGGFDRVVRHWDAADSKSDDSSWTAGVKIGKRDQDPAMFYVIDVQRFKKSGGQKKKAIKNITSQDKSQHGEKLEVGFEQEPGSGGKYQAEDLASSVPEVETYIHNPTGDKVARNGPFRASADLGQLKLMKGQWNQEYLDELVSFPEGPNDDMVDGSSGAYNRLNEEPDDDGPATALW